MALNTFISTLYKIFRKLVHKIGLNHFWGIRRFADFLKSIYERIRLPSPVIIQGIKFAKVPPQVWLNGSYEPNTTCLCKRIIKNGWTTIDLGADFGYYSLLFAKLVGPKGKVFTFEPSGEGFNYLIKNITINNFTNIVPLKKAVGDKSGLENFFVRQGTPSFYNLHLEREKREIKKVESVRLDDFFKDYPKLINFIKMDIEGAEIKALHGMEDILEKNHEIKLVIELAPRLLDKIKILPQNLLSQLRKYGLRLYWINSDGTINKMSDEEIILRARKETRTNIFCSQ